jgi:hypothetical protein
VLFGHHGKIAGGLEIPKPYVVAARSKGSDLLAEVVLFGFAGDWADTVADALARGLRLGLNDGDADKAHYRPLEVVTRTISGQTGLDPIMGGTGAILMITMETPLSIRKGNIVKVPDFGDLVSSLTARIEGLARWHDAALFADWPTLIHEGRTLRRHDVARLPPVFWRRGSTRQNRTFQVGGSGGQWLVDTPSPELLALLTLGQTTGAGGRTTLGLGRFRIDSLPAKIQAN